MSNGQKSLFGCSILSYLLVLYSFFRFDLWLILIFFIIHSLVLLTLAFLFRKNNLEDNDLIELQARYQKLAADNEIQAESLRKKPICRFRRSRMRSSSCKTHRPHRKSRCRRPSTTRIKQNRKNTKHFFLRSTRMKTRTKRSILSKSHRIRFRNCIHSPHRLILRSFSLPLRIHYS